MKYLQYGHGYYSLNAQKISGNLNILFMTLHLQNEWFFYLKKNDIIALKKWGFISRPQWVMLIFQKYYYNLNEKLVTKNHTWVNRDYAIFYSYFPKKVLATSPLSRNQKSWKYNVHLWSKLKFADNEASICKNSFWNKPWK